MSGFQTVKEHKARKIHNCEECFLNIPIGSKYISVSGKYEGEFFYVKNHKECHEKVIELNKESGPYDWWPLSDWDAARDFNFKDHRKMITEKYKLVAR